LEKNKFKFFQIERELPPYHTGERYKTEETEKKKNELKTTGPPVR